ncbi:hypothetical protein TNCV_3003271 [Trichonephila clavipes]|nr:hypothetical protein TNCV_3003271 [Trichonephila clavipes]
MTAPLSICSKKRRKTVIRFLFDVKPALGNSLPLITIPSPYCAFMHRMSSTTFSPSAKKKANYCPPFLSDGDRQWSCHVERSATIQRLREKTSETLHRSVVDYPIFTAGC